MYEFALGVLGFSSPEFFEMTLRELFLRRRAFLFKEANEWDRQRWLVASINAMLGGKQTPQQILHIELLDGKKKKVVIGPVTQKTKDFYAFAVKFFAEKEAKETQQKVDAIQNGTTEKGTLRRKIVNGKHVVIDQDGKH